MFDILGTKVGALYILDKSVKFVMYKNAVIKRNSRIPKGQTENVKSEDGKYHVQQIERKTYNTQHFTEN